MLDAAEPLAGAHTLVLAQPSRTSVELLCGLIGRGCGAAAEQAADSPLQVETAEIVLVPQVESLDAATRAILAARRCLLPCGRIVMQDADGTLAKPIARLLAAAGFSFVRITPGADGAIISADWPMFGPHLHASPGHGLGHRLGHGDGPGRA